MKGKLIYEETQGFRGSWSWYMIIGASLFMIWTFGKGFYTQIILNETWGDKPMSDNGLIITFILIIVLMAAIFIFIDMHKLYLQVDEGSIRYKYVPYFRTFKSVHKDQLKSVKVTRYKPLMEYGGWGYRTSFNGKKKAYNIKGNWGLLLEFVNGKKLMIGTQKQVELDKAINQLKENWERI